MSDTRLNRCLAEQVDFLRASAERFDAGEEHEAKRLALTIRVVVYDSHNGDSLLAQLGLKSKLGFLDTRARRKPPAGRQVVEPLGWPIGMVHLEMALAEPSIGASTVYRAALGSDKEARAGEAAFDTWWNEPLLVSADGIEFSRRRFITGAANKEGGAHVDPRPPAWWRDLRDGTWIGAGTTASPGGPVPIANLAPTVIRQIAYELLSTLEAAGRAAPPLSNSRSAL